MTGPQPAAPSPPRSLAIVGGGPAGLMAAQEALSAGLSVTLYESRPSVGRKFLIAGRGGLNLTHSEPFDRFRQRYREAEDRLRPYLEAFDAAAIVRWCHGLGIETFVGTSGRVFPTDFKAAPLLRAWLHALRAAGLQIRVRHRFTGFTGARGLRFDTPEGSVAVQPDAVILACGGASWPHLGSDGAWVAPLREAGIPVSPLRPANCGFEVPWSEHFAGRHGGHPVKSVAASTRERDGRLTQASGELMITTAGIEGGLVYQLSAPLRDTIDREGKAQLILDLAPGRSNEQLTGALARPRGRKTLARHLEAAAGISGVKAGLLREVLSVEEMGDPKLVAATIKALPLSLHGTRPIDEAISSAGGVTFAGLDEHLMLRELPGVFCAGEMLDWEAPTGGYLLTACFATGIAAARGATAWLSQQRKIAAV